jgi:VCBS repeat-containing protein
MNRVGKSIRFGSVIGRQILTTGTSRAKVRLNARAVRAIRSGSLKKVRLTVKTRDGASSSRTVRVAGN